MTRRWTSIVWALAGLLLLASCGGRSGTPPRPTGPVSRPAGPSSGCAPRLVWHGRAYAGVALVRAPALTGPLGRGVLPPCNDSEGRAISERVSVRTIRGVAPARALAVDYDPRLVFVAESPEGGPSPLPPELAPLRAPA